MCLILKSARAGNKARQEYLNFSSPCKELPNPVWDPPLKRKEYFGNLVSHTLESKRLTKNRKGWLNELMAFLHFYIIATQQQQNITLAANGLSLLLIFALSLLPVFQAKAVNWLLSKMEAFNNCTGPGGDLEQQNYESEHFFYFAYGSNLLRERIMLRNPSVVFLTIAQLLLSSRETKSSVERRQEGVENGIYIPIEVTVRTRDGKIVKCRSYQMNDYVHDLPSPQYKRVICLGARQNELPMDYQKKLNSIETNNYAGPVPVYEEIKAALSASGKQNNEDQF